MQWFLKVFFIVGVVLAQTGEARGRRSQSQQYIIQQQQAAVQKPVQVVKRPAAPVKEAEPDFLANWQPYRGGARIIGSIPLVNGLVEPPTPALKYDQGKYPYPPAEHHDIPGWDISVSYYDKYIHVSKDQDFYSYIGWPKDLTIEEAKKKGLPVPHQIAEGIVEYNGKLYYNSERTRTTTKKNDREITVTTSQWLPNKQKYRGYYEPENPKQDYNHMSAVLNERMDKAQYEFLPLSYDTSNVAPYTRTHGMHFGNRIAMSQGFIYNDKEIKKSEVHYQLKAGYFVPVRSENGKPPTIAAGWVVPDSEKADIANYTRAYYRERLRDYGEEYFATKFFKGKTEEAWYAPWLSELKAELNDPQWDPKKATDLVD